MKKTHAVAYLSILPLMLFTWLCASCVLPLSRDYFSRVPHIYADDLPRASGWILNISRSSIAVPLIWGAGIAFCGLLVFIARHDKLNQVFPFCLSLVWIVCISYLMIYVMGMGFLGFSW